MAGQKNGKKFVLCINNEDCEDLEVGKVYRVLPDALATKSDLLRVIDESGEDYLYPADLFVPIELPQGAKRALAALST
ncbi:MAG: hypothetical protein KGJ80_05680 [Chloroflexota bacterium]|nr:hypothetical protein [Chloroflexota bacterium]